MPARKHYLWLIAPMLLHLFTLVHNATIKSEQNVSRFTQMQSNTLSNMFRHTKPKPKKPLNIQFTELFTSSFRVGSLTVSLGHISVRDWERQKKKKMVSRLGILSGLVICSVWRETLHTQSLLIEGSVASNIANCCYTSNGPLSFLIWPSAVSMKQ